MKKFLFGPVLGLAIIINGLTAATPANAFTLHNYYSYLLPKDYCLAVAGVPPDNQKVRAGLIVWHCDGTPGQDWGYNSPGVALPPPPSNGSYLGDFLVSSVFTDRYLNTAEVNNALVNGSPVFVWNSTGSLTQQWEMWWQGKDFRGHDCYIIESRDDSRTKLNSGYAPMVLSVKGGLKTEGTPVIIYQQFFDSTGFQDYRHHPDQYWCAYN